MTKKNLEEAAKDILSQNVKSKQKEAEKGKDIAGGEDNGQEMGLADTSVKKPTEPTKTATPPGKKPPMGQMPMQKVQGADYKEGQLDTAASGSNGGESMKSIASYTNAVREDTDDETIDVGDMVYNEETGLSGKVVSIDEDTGDIEVEWLSEEEETEEEVIEEDYEDDIVLEDFEDSDEPLNEKVHHLHVTTSSKGQTKKHKAKVTADTPEEAKNKVGVYFSKRGYNVRKVKTVSEELETQFDINTIKMDEDVKPLFEGQEDLSEEFVKKTVVLFETAVKAKVNEYIEVLDKIYEERLHDEVEDLKESLSDEVENFLGYVAQEWLEENRVGLENQLRTQIAENFITGLHNLFVESNINVPDQQLDVVEEIIGEKEEIAENYNKEIEKNIELRDALIESVKMNLVFESALDVEEQNREKAIKLFENLEFDGDAEDFMERVEIVKSSFLKEDKNIFRGKKAKLDDDSVANDGGYVVEDLKLIEEENQQDDVSGAIRLLKSQRRK